MEVQVIENDGRACVRLIGQQGILGVGDSLTCGDDLALAMRAVRDATENVVLHEREVERVTEILTAARVTLTLAQERVDELMAHLKAHAPSNTAWSRGRLPR